MAKPDADVDRFQLQRFVDAQESTYAQALNEIRAGLKQSHWMWFIFPQFSGLGSSSMAQRYGIKSADEARAYLAHPILGARLTECVEAVLAAEARTVVEVFGHPDDLKLRSSATLFAAVSPAGSLFERLLAKWFASEPDEATLRLMDDQRSPV